MKKFFEVHDRFFRIPFMVAAGTALLATIIHGCGMGKNLTMVVQEFPRASTCGHCHIDIFNEWSASPHAEAYTNPRYREATDEYRFTECLGCHTPEPAVSNITPSHRAIYRDEGVTCISCHLEEGKLSGPLSPTGMVTPHPVGVDADQYRDSRFCGRCHEGTFAEWGTVTMKDKRTCQQCHMPEQIRKITQPAGTLSRFLVSFEKNVVQKRHTFAAIPGELEIKPYSLEIRYHKEKATITATNNLPHSLPAGDFGIRINVLSVSIVDAKGDHTAIAERELIKDLGSAIPPQSSVEWEVAIPPEAREICVRMTRRGYENIDTHELMQTVILLP